MRIIFFFFSLHTNLKHVIKGRKLGRFTDKYQKVLCPDILQIWSPKDAFGNLPTASSVCGKNNTVNLKAQQYLHIRAFVRSHRS